MSTKPMKPLGKKQKTLDLSKADTLQCDKCENMYYLKIGNSSLKVFKKN